MNCISCKEEVSEKSQYALSQNVCPFCGKGIISEADHFFRRSIVAILEKNGLTDTNAINNVVNDIVKVLEGPSPEEAREQGIVLTVGSPVGEGGGSAVTVDANGVTTPVQLADQTVAQKLANKKPPKAINLRSSGGSSSLPIGPMPSESMDLSDMEDDLGAPTAEEAAEIQAMVDRGEIVFTSLH